MSRHFRGRADDAGPDIPDPHASELEENVLGLLEEAGCPEDVCHQIAKLIQMWEHSQLPVEPDWPTQPDDDPNFDEPPMEGPAHE